MIDPKRIRKKIFKALKSQSLQIKMYDSSGMAVVDPELAERFYVDSPNLLIHIDGENEEVIFNKEKSDTTPLEVYAKIISLVKAIVREYMYKFTLREFGKTIQPKDFSYQTKSKEQNAMESVCESAMYGSKKTSRQAVDNVDIVVRHTKNIDESVRGARTRNIQAIFLESNGERLKFPHNSLRGARAMARHLSNGGSMSDTIGESIVDMTSKLRQLREFHLYTRVNKLINEGTQDVVSTIEESISGIKADLDSLYKKKTYESTVARISERGSVIVEGMDGVDYKEMFTVKQFNEKYEQILPLITSIVHEKATKMKNIEEQSLNPVRLKRRLSENTAIVYADKNVRFGNRLKEMAEMMVEQSELSAYVRSVGEKLLSEGKLSDFEKAIVKNVIENVVFDSTPGKTDIISEACERFERELVGIEKNAYLNMSSVLSSRYLSEATDSERYEDVVFIQGDEAEEPLEILRNQGKMAALKYLTQWHSPGHHMGRHELPFGTDDEIFRHGDYIMGWNSRIGYIGLVHDYGDLNEGISDFISGAKDKFANFFSKKKNELDDLGDRLKKIGDTLKQQGILDETAPEGWEGTVKAMKKHKDIDNPWALAHYMKNKGDTSHIEEDEKVRSKLDKSKIGFKPDQKKNPTKLKFEVAVHRFNTCRKALALANALKNSEDKAHHQGRVFKMLNILRRDVEDLEKGLGRNKKERPDVPAPNRFMGGIFGKPIMKKHKT